jgi:hypothetical protein
MPIDECSCGTCFDAFRKNGFACHPLLSVAFICMMSLILFRHFVRRYPVLSDWMPSYHVVRRQGFHSHILVTQDWLCELSLVGYKVMAIVAVNNLQNHRLLIVDFNGKLLQALSLAIAFRYYIAAGWVLL